MTLSFPQFVDKELRAGRTIEEIWADLDNMHAGRPNPGPTNPKPPKKHHPAPPPSGPPPPPESVPLPPPSEGDFPDNSIPPAPPGNEMDIEDIPSDDEKEDEWARLLKKYNKTGITIKMPHGRRGRRMRRNGGGVSHAVREYVKKHVARETNKQTPLTVYKNLYTTHFAWVIGERGYFSDGFLTNLDLDTIFQKMKVLVLDQSDSGSTPTVTDHGNALYRYFDIEWSDTAQLPWQIEITGYKKYTFVNNGEFPCDVTFRKLQCRNHTSDAGEMAVQAMWQNDLYEAGTTEALGTAKNDYTSTADVRNTFYAQPEDSKRWKSYFKVLSKKTYRMQPGHEHSVVQKSGKRIIKIADLKDLRADYLKSTPAEILQNIGGLTQYVYILAQGPLCHEVGTAADHSFGPGVIDMAVMETYTMRIKVNGSETAFLSANQTLDTIATGASEKAFNTHRSQIVHS